MKITRIENQKNRPGRKNIFADGEFLVGMATDTLLRFGLRTGDEITPARVREIAHAEELLAARSAALRFLSVRPRTEREIRDALREKEYGDATAAQTIDALKEAGLLDDAAFARSFIRNALVLKPTGRVLLKRKLLLLGVEKGMAEEALEEILEGVDQAEEAYRAAAKFLARKRPSRVPDPKIRQQLTAFLVRRGYTWDIVEPVLKRAMKGEAE